MSLYVKVCRLNAFLLSSHGHFKEVITGECKFHSCSTPTSTRVIQADMKQDVVQSMGSVSDLYRTPELFMPHLYSQFAKPLFAQDMIHEPNKQIPRLAKPSIFLHAWSQASLTEAV